MRRILVPTLMAAALGAAMMFSVGMPYDLAAQNLEIHRTQAAEVLQDAMRQDAIAATEDRPEIPPFTIVTGPKHRDA